jgi:hypothetical protein
VILAVSPDQSYTYSHTNFSVTFLSLLAVPQMLPSHPARLPSLQVTQSTLLRILASSIFVGELWYAPEKEVCCTNLEIVGPRGEELVANMKSLRPIDAAKETLAGENAP